MLYQLYHWPTTNIINTLYNLNKRILKRKRERFILLSAFPRSACNHLSYLLSESLRYEQKELKAASGIYHDCIYMPKLVDLMVRKAIVTQHLRLTSVNYRIIKELNIKPIVQVRNIFDVVVSYRDYIAKNGYAPLDLSQDDHAPGYCKAYPDFDEMKKIDYIIDTVVPWYITFYASWYIHTKENHNIDAYWVKYEDLITVPHKILNEIFDFYNLSVPPKRLDAIIGRNEKVNFNKGIVGRGECLSESQKNRIRKIADYYPTIDFKMMGL